MGSDLHSSPLEKIVWVSDLCPIFIFPPVEGIGVGHFRAGAPLVMFFPISFITDKVLYTPATSACIHYFVDVPLLSAVFSDNWHWLSWFPVREEEWVVGDISF